LTRFFQSSQACAWDFLDFLHKQLDRLLSLLGIETSGIEQPIPILAKVFEALQSVEADCTGLAEVNDSLRFH
jgi:hypothetical protein